MLAAAILAAGESRRMGSAKALLAYRGKTFLEHLLEVVAHPRVGIVRVVVGAQREEILARVEIEASRVVVNEQWERGQLSSIQAAIRSLPEGAREERAEGPLGQKEIRDSRETEGLLIALVDQPLVSSALIAQLIEAFDQSDAAVVLPTYRGKRGHPVIFRRRLYRELLEAPDSVGARAVVRAHREELREVQSREEGVVLNLNDPATLERALKAGE